MTESLKRYKAQVEFRDYSFQDAVDQLNRDGYKVTSVSEVEVNPDE